MKPENKIYITTAVFGILAIIFYIFLIMPLFSEIKKESDELISAKNDITTIVNGDKEIENFKNRYPEYKPNFEKMDKMFADSKNPVDFIKFLEQTASSSKITSKISLVSPGNFGDRSYLDFQFFSEGDYQKIMEFVKNIESGPYLVEVESITMGSSANFLIRVFTK